MARLELGDDRWRKRRCERQPRRSHVDASARPIDRGDLGAHERARIGRRARLAASAATAGRRGDARRLDFRRRGRADRDAKWGEGGDSEDHRDERDGRFHHRRQ
jgi:hypothetical protein